MPVRLLPGRRFTSYAIKQCTRRASTRSAPLSKEKDEMKLWLGLESWRSLQVDDRRGWSGNRPVSIMSESTTSVSLPCTLPACGELVLKTPDPIEKARLTHQIYSELKQGKIEIQGEGNPPDFPSRPQRPRLVSPKELPSIENSTLPKSVFMLHNLAHIELNAVDLAWDTLVRFAHLKLWDDFYIDFAHVADDESRHFLWCENRMNQLGYKYGDMVAHDILWRAAESSTLDITARLAVIPMGQEARGLDAGPRVADRLFSFNDRSSGFLVKRIASEEKAHVAVGMKHFMKILCLLEEDPKQVFRGWLHHLAPDLTVGRFDHFVRTEVGLPRQWYDRKSWEEDVGDMEALQELSFRLKEFLAQEEEMRR